VQPDVDIEAGSDDVVDQEAFTAFEDEHEELHEPDPEPTLRVLVYSDDRIVRAQVLSALGRRPAVDLPALEYTECATEPVVIQHADRGRFDLLILDGEATPAGGLGVCRQLKDEIYNCPPILVLVGRPQDAWLATWSRADGIVPHPIDAIALAEVTARLLRARTAVVPA
jgi:CheY-like chemotaxis protein